MRKIKILNNLWIDKLYQIEKKCFKYPWNKKFFENEFKKSINKVYGLFIDENLIGFTIIGVLKKYQIAHIKNFAIKLDKQNQNEGSFLLSEIHNILKNKGIKSIFLEVRISNKKALKLYKKFNYEILEIIDNYYNNTQESAYRMRFNLEN